MNARPTSKLHLRTTGSADMETTLLKAALAVEQAPLTHDAGALRRGVFYRTGALLWPTLPTNESRLRGTAMHPRGFVAVVAFKLAHFAGAAEADRR